MRPIKLQMKLRAAATKEQLAEAISLAESAGATAVRPLFPASADKELASLFVIDVRDGAAARRVRGSLEKVACVEFVEDEVRRKLR